jgi:hypothetical protein
MTFDGIIPWNSYYGSKASSNMVKSYRMAAIVTRPYITGHYL